MARNGWRHLMAVTLVAALLAALSSCGSPVRWSSLEGTRCDHGVIVGKVPIHNDLATEITVVITGTGVGGTVELGRKVVSAYSKDKVPLRQEVRGQLGITVVYTGVDTNGQPVGKVLASFRGPNNDCGS